MTQIPGAMVLNSLCASDELEHQLTAIWRNVLKLDKIIDIDDDFFKLGGKPMKAVIVAMRVQKNLNYRLPVSKLDKLNTIRKQAEYIRKYISQISSFDEHHDLASLGMESRPQSINAGSRRHKSNWQATSFSAPLHYFS